MKKNKLLFLIFFFTMFSFIFNVSADIVTCDYGKYILEYDKDKYVTIVDHATPYSYLKVYNSQHKVVEYTFYPEGDPNKNYDIVLSNNASLFRNQPDAQSQCVSILILQNKDGAIVKLDLLNGYDSNNSNDSSNNSNNRDNSDKVNCGNVTNIPRKIPGLTSFAITIVQVAVPVLLVVMGTLDLFKGVTSQKEDEMKKARQVFVKRLIVGASIFFIIVITKFLISVIANTSSANIIECIDCFLSNICK